MGYCITQEYAEFSIKAENFCKALAAIKDLAGRETIRCSGGPSHFSWVETEEFLQARTLREAMEAWRWDVEMEDGVIGIEFTGEKLGDDLMLFKAIAPFVEPGSYIEMRGEDGAHWRWIFEDGDVKEKVATVTW